jgi:hypothetical protein
MIQELLLEWCTVDCEQAEVIVVLDVLTDGPNGLSHLVDLFT